MKPARSYSPYFVEAWHFGSLAAQKGTAGLTTTRSNAFDNFGDDLRNHPARSDIVHEKQRRGTLHQDVVDAVGNQIAPTVWWMPVTKATFSLVPTPSTLETSTGLDGLPAAERKQPSKSADFREHTRSEGASRERFDSLLGEIRLIDVYTGVAIAGNELGHVGLSVLREESPQR